MASLVFGIFLIGRRFSDAGGMKKSGTLQCRLVDTSKSRHYTSSDIVLLFEDVLVVLALRACVGNVTERTHD